MDIGLEICRELRVSMPVFATVALSDVTLRQQNPLTSPFLQAVSAQVASRAGLAGAYIVIAQESVDDSYVCEVPDTLMSLLLLTDDLVLGAGKAVIVNYHGHVWRDHGGGRRASGQPDIIARSDDSGSATWMTKGADSSRGTSASRCSAMSVWIKSSISSRRMRYEIVCSPLPTPPFNRVLRAGGKVADVREREYSQTNIAAAGGHYNTIMHALGNKLDSVAAERRVEVLNRVVVRAESVADEVLDAP